MASPYARVDVLHSAFPGRRWAELRIDIDASIGEVKEKLYKHTGTSSSNMTLQLLLPSTDSQQQQKCIPLVDADELSLRMFGCLPSGCTLLISDSSGVNGGGSGCAAAAAAGDVAAAAAADRDTDISSRYRMADEVYEQRGDSMRRFLRNLQSSKPELFQQQQEEEQQQQQQDEQQQENEEEIRQMFPIGSRCMLSGDRRGCVVFVGARPSRPNGEVWIGVALDEPLGLTDGRDFRFGGLQPAAAAAATATAAAAAAAAAAGRKLVFSSKRLFECSGDKYGEWVKPKEVTVGDFPPLDPFDLIDEI